MTVARERILDAAYDPSRRGIRAVGIDSIIERSGVARMTLYRHFGSKDALVLAFLERREQRWTRTGSSARSRRTADPAERLLAIFDVFDEWFQRPEFEGCSFINVLLEIADPATTCTAPADHLADPRLPRRARGGRGRRRPRGLAQFTS